MVAWVRAQWFNFKFCGMVLFGLQFIVSVSLLSCIPELGTADLTQTTGRSRSKSLSPSVGKAAGVYSTGKLQVASVKAPARIGRSLTGKHRRTFARSESPSPSRHKKLRDNLNSSDHGSDSGPHHDGASASPITDLRAVQWGVQGAMSAL
jgi:hypothetical protein